MGSASSALDPLGRLQNSSGVPKKDIKALYEKHFADAGTSIDLRRALRLQTLLKHPKLASNTAAQACLRSRAAGDYIRFEDLIFVLGKFLPSTTAQAKLNFLFSVFAHGRRELSETDLVRILSLFLHRQLPPSVLAAIARDHVRAHGRNAVLDCDAFVQALRGGDVPARLTLTLLP
eukprot:m.91151 g.91151  ORF g.91151 m.91151 type:complete len:176 (-) comp13724_c0_seq3:67-594(-)